MEPELDRRLTGIETKLDTQDGKIQTLLVLVPQFVTWRKLAGAAVTLASLIASITFAILNLAL